MTSRRSRLKAIANLPVRRKLDTTETNNDGISPKPEKTPDLPQPAFAEPELQKETVCSQKADEVVTEHSNTLEDKEKSFTAITDCNNSLNSPKIVTANSEIISTDVVESLNQTSDSICEKISETNNDISLNKSSNSFTFKSNKRFKPNVNICSVREKTQAPVVRAIDQDVQLEVTNVNTSESNSNIRIDNFLEEGVKCYTVLTPLSLPNTTFTIARLAPCESNNDTILNQSNVQPEEFEEVQIYTELEPSQLYANLTNSLHDASENCNLSFEQSEPVYTTLTNCNSDPKLVNFNLSLSDFDPNLSENCKQSTKNVVIKPSENFNRGVVLNGNKVNQTNSVPQKQDKSENNYTKNFLCDSDCNNLNYKKYAAVPRKKWNKNNDLVKKLADARRDFQKRYKKMKPDRSTLKMIDLIFYNPSTNPMESKSRLEKKDQRSGGGGGGGDLIKEMLAEERVDEPDAGDNSSNSFTTNNNDLENSNKMPVPQVKIGLNGEIILDEKSLVIETTEAKKGREDLQNSVPIFEDRGSRVSYYGSKTRKTREWTGFETKRFYKALNTIGPDFSLMQKYFPRRSRIELKNKFKREERLNKNLIDRALNNPSEFDMTLLEKDLDVEKRAQEEVEMRICMKRDRRNSKKKNVKVRLKGSQLSRELVDSDEESENDRQPEDILTEDYSLTEESKRQREKNFVFQKILLKTSENQNS